ncbi:MAG: HEAT repeat domain-containing protein [bacterium]|nr:HEAT repeat domain-containing protein [bacterium]
MTRILDSPRCFHVYPWLMALILAVIISPVLPLGAAQQAEGTLHTPFPGTPLSSAAQAAVEAARSGNPAAIRALLPFFDTEDNELLVRFVITLKDQAALPLIEALDDPSPRTSEVAAGLLGEIRAKQAVPKLTEFLKSGRQRRYVAAWALGEIKNPESIHVLVAALADRNESVVKAATRALINIGRKSTSAILSALPSSSGRPRKAMLRALEDIEDTKAEDAILAVLDTEKEPMIQAAAARSLSKCGTRKSYAPLERWLLEGEVPVRVECAWSLGILIARPAEGALRQTLEHADPNVREWSARALENITGERVLYRDAKGKMVLPYNLYR